jgi:hypothetical protein
MLLEEMDKKYAEFEAKCQNTPDYEDAFAIIDVLISELTTVDAVPVVHGEWMLEAHKEPNYHWSVKAECSNCCHENGEVWGAYFPNVPDSLAKDTALLYANEVKISNFCPECGADMRKKVQE